MARRRLRAGNDFTLCLLGGRDARVRAGDVFSVRGDGGLPPAAAPDAARGGESRPGPS